jgi:GH24 family phage-related lysozyme (muramidase)
LALDTYHGADLGVGVFQLSVGQNSPYTTQQAQNLTSAATAAAQLLNHDQTVLAAAHPNLTPDQLEQATAASYNIGTGNISGNPATIDAGTARNNHGSNILQLMQDCLE